MSLQSSYVTTTTSALYTSSGNTAAMTFYVSNYSANATTFSLWAVQSGQTPSNLNVLYSNVTVQGGDTYVIDTERLFLDNGDELYIYANANSRVSCTLTYTTI